jgi:methionyl-tRNA formyltransferase
MEKKFSEIGAELFYKNYYDIIDNIIIEKKQKHEDATFCKKYQKSDMELEFPFSEKNSRKNFLKFCAFSKPFYFDENKKRNIVTDAS